MEKEYVHYLHYLKNFAIQSQLSKRCASYPTLPYGCATAASYRVYLLADSCAALVALNIDPTLTIG